MLRRLHDTDEPKTLNGAWFLPCFLYWTVDCYVKLAVLEKSPDWKFYTTYKFYYERGYDPEEYVHRSFSRANISLGDGVYVHDKTSQYYKLENYQFIDGKEAYDMLDCSYLDGMSIQCHREEIRNANNR
tara:strand:- start:1464 stop:1850 length:387 start_codon:yes stop_codon:yes gene_type:complete